MRARMLRQTFRTVKPQLDEGRVRLRAPKMERSRKGMEQKPEGRRCPRFAHPRRREGDRRHDGRAAHRDCQGELDDGKERTAHHVDDTGFCTVRGADGTERLMSAADADLGTVVELMECAYSAYQDESVKDNAGYIMKHYDVLRGKTPPAA